MSRLQTITPNGKKKNQDFIIYNSLMHKLQLGVALKIKL